MSFTDAGAAFKEVRNENFTRSLSPDLELFVACQLSSSASQFRFDSEEIVTLKCKALRISAALLM